MCFYSSVFFRAFLVVEISYTEVAENYPVAYGWSS